MPNSIICTQCMANEIYLCIAHTKELMFKRMSHAICSVLFLFLASLLPYYVLHLLSTSDAIVQKYSVSYIYVHTLIIIIVVVISISMLIVLIDFDLFYVPFSSYSRDFQIVRSNFSAITTGF